MRHSILTQPAESQGLRHDPTTIALHWISAVLVAALWTIGQTVDVFPNGPLRVDYRSVHIVLGVALGLVLTARLGWRLTRSQNLPPIDSGLLLVLARVTHWLLYVLVFATTLSGWLFASFRGWSISFFYLVPLPMLAGASPAAIKVINGWHQVLEWTLLIVAGAHIGSALVHRYVYRDRILQRMLPG